MSRRTRMQAAGLGLLVGALSLATPGFAPGLSGLLGRGEAQARARAQKRRSDPWCFRRLRQARVRYRHWHKTKGVKSPVRPIGSIGGIRYARVNGSEAPLLDCRMLLTMWRAAPLFKANGIATVYYSTFYTYKRVKNTAVLSRHSFGMAVDIHGFGMVSGQKISVRDHWEKGRGNGKTCEGETRSWRAQVLRNIACDLDRSYLFKVVLTPDFDKEHDNHFHIQDFLHDDKKRLRPNNRTVLGEYRWKRPSWARVLSPTGRYRRSWIRRVALRRRNLRRRRKYAKRPRR